MIEKKLIIFDFDGVIYPVTKMQMQRIINSSQTVQNSTTEKKGDIPTTKFLKKIWGKPIIDMAQTFKKELNWSDNQINLFLNQESEKSHYFENGLAENFQDLVKSLKTSGLELAICSNRPSDSFYPLTEKLKINSKDFSTIILGDSCENNIKKPDKRVLDIVFERGYLQKEVILIGDSINADFQTAVNTQIDFVGIISVLHDEQDFLEAFKKTKNIKSNYLILNHINQLKDLFHNP